MSRFCDRPILRLALIGALVASLGLAACGRKGPLDPPPASLVSGENAASPGSGPAKRYDTVGPNGLPHAPKDSGRHIPLDVLLN